MRLFTFFIFISFLSFSSCSSFEEQLQPDISVENLSLDNIKTDLPVISLTANADEFAEMFREFEENIEIEGRFSLYRNGELVIADEEVELELKGNYSKRFDVKSLGVKFEDRYDNSDRSLINPPTVLPHHNLDKIKAIRLRSSGSDYRLTMLKDMSYAQLAVEAGLDLDLSYGTPGIIFFNGAFHALLNIRTEANGHGVSALYGKKKENVTLAQVENPAVVKKIGDFERIDRLTAAIENGDLDYVKSEVDLNNFRDYMIFESYIANVDWPFNNVRFYAIDGGKFRFTLFDLDLANTIFTGRSPFYFKVPKKESAMSDLFTLLYDDADFKADYDNRYRELLDSGKFSTAQFEEIVQKNMKSIEQAIVWQIQKYNAPASLTEWHSYTTRLVEMFAERESVVLRIID